MRVMRVARAATEAGFLSSTGPAASEAIELHHSSPWSLSSTAFVTEFEDLEPIISLLVLVAVVLVWVQAQIAARGEPAEEQKLGGVDAATTPASSLEAGRPRSSRSVVWLGTLAAAATALLVFQGALGHFSGSLTLLADMGHAAGDTVTYLAAYLVEKAKHDLTTRKGALGSAAWIDAFAGTASTLLVAGVSVNAMVDAANRLRSKAPEGEGEDLRMIGPAILTFAIVSLAVNLGLLAFRARESEDTVEDDEAAEIEMPPPPPPQPAFARPARTRAKATSVAGPAAVPSFEAPPVPPPAFDRPARTRASRTAGRAAMATAFASPDAEASFESVPPPPSPVAVPGFDAPPPPPRPRLAREVKASSANWLKAAFRPACEGCDDEACKNEMDGSPGSQQKQASTWWQTLHAALHPGCDGCGDEACGSKAGDLTPAQKDEEEEEDNLNLFGATLHLATDVVRSIIVLFTGCLLRAGILTDVARTDAACALVVGLCVLLGSAAFFYAPLMKLLSKRSAAAEA